MSVSGELGGVLVAVVWLVSLAVLVVLALVGTRVWRRARRGGGVPVLTERARVVDTREGERSGYYITVEFADGRRREYLIWGEEFALLGPGDTGLLTHRGESYLRFVRDPGPAAGERGVTR